MIDTAELKVVIFVMSDPREAVKPERFVTVGTSKPSSRVNTFFAAAKRNRSPVLDWITELATLRLRPTTSILECVDKNSWTSAKDFWIAALRSEGCSLLNADVPANRKRKIREDVRQDPTFPRKVIPEVPLAKPEPSDEERLAEKLGLPIERWGKGLLPEKD